MLAKAREAELLQLLHRNRRALPEGAGDEPVLSVAARLGAGGIVESQRGAAGGSVARHRRGIREVAIAEGEDADGELADVLRPGGDGGSADHGGDGAAEGAQGIRASV